MYTARVYYYSKGNRKDLSVPRFGSHRSNSLSGNREISVRMTFSCFVRSSSAGTSMDSDKLEIRVGEKKGVTFASF